LVIVLAAGALTFFGVRTFDEVQAKAKEEAQKKVEEILKEPNVQELVRETAKKLFSQGAFQEAIRAEVQHQLKAEVPAEIKRLKLEPRKISGAVAQEFREWLQKFGRSKVLIRYCRQSEPSDYGRSLVVALEQAHVGVLPREVGANTQDELECTTASDSISVFSDNVELRRVLIAMVNRATGEAPREQGLSDADVNLPDVKLEAIIKIHQK
jgi:hypothetical protein